MCETNQQNFFIVKCVASCSPLFESYATGDNEEVSPKGYDQGKEPLFRMK